MFLPCAPPSHILENNVQDSLFFGGGSFFSLIILSVKNVNHVTHVIPLSSRGGALRSKEVAAVKVFACDLRPLLPLAGSSELLQIQPAAQMDTEKITKITAPGHCPGALLSVSTWWRQRPTWKHSGTNSWRFSNKMRNLNSQYVQLFTHLAS